VPFLLNAIGIVAVVWFGEKERNVATTISGLCNICGSVLGLLISGWCALSFNDLTIADPTYKQTVKDSCYKIILIENIILTTTALPFIFIIKEAPPTPPSCLDAKDLGSKNSSGELKQLLRNKNYILMALPFSVLFGLMNGIGNILSPFFQPFGYTPF